MPIEMRAENLVLHQTGDPEVVIGEFEYVGRVTTTGRAFRAGNIFVLRVRHGEIVESRDYANHLAFASALDRLPELLASVEKEDAKRMP